MDSQRLPDILELSDHDIDRLRKIGLVHLPPPAPQAKKPPIDYAAIQQTYRRMLAEGPFSSQTELACHLGVSRAWVSVVLKGIKRKVG
jgi:hypothetical protein